MIERVEIVKMHDREFRPKKKCDTCGRRRLCTRQTVRAEGSSHTWDIHSCNECLTATPHWSQFVRSRTCA